VGDRPPRVLVTRPREDARALAEALAARGVETVVEPMLDINFLPSPELDLAGVRALLFTSANGARAFARASARRDLPVLAVGPATARAARDAGFAEVEVAGGDVAALARLAAERRRAAEGALLHVSGSAVAGDLAGRLGAQGFDVRRAVLYEARAAEALSPATAKDLARGAIDGVMLFSPRTARTFVTLVARAGLADALAATEALCLSEAVADAARALPWRAVRIAERPDQAALVALVAPAAARTADGAERNGRR